MPFTLTCVPAVSAITVAYSPWVEGEGKSSSTYCVPMPVTGRTLSAPSSPQPPATPQMPDQPRPPVSSAIGSVEVTSAASISRVQVLPGVVRAT